MRMTGRMTQLMRSSGCYSKAKDGKERERKKHLLPSVHTFIPGLPLCIHPLTHSFTFSLAKKAAIWDRLFGLLEITFADVHTTVLQSLLPFLTIKYRLRVLVDS